MEFSTLSLAAVIYVTSGSFLCGNVKKYHYVGSLSLYRDVHNKHLMEYPMIQHSTDHPTYHPTPYPTKMLNKYHTQHPTY